LLLAEKEILKDLDELEHLITSHELGMSVMYFVKIKSAIAQINVQPSLATASEVGKFTVR